MTPRVRAWNDGVLSEQLAFPGELIVDSFAGGGGASLGIEMALGRSPDIAINHDKEALALHEANHPTSKHFREDVWQVDPKKACDGRPVGLMWLSPDCKHFSKAKGGKPVNKKIRSLAWVAIRWAKAVKPRVMVLENVEEFQDWGPVLRETNKPCPKRKGQTFRAFVRALERCGYRVEWKQLRACDFGAPTSRRRLFLVARRDGQPIMWPAPTHGPGLLPWRTAAECIDWSVPCHSIFITKAKAARLRKTHGINIKRPLAKNTMRRIGRGVWRFVIDNPRPFIVSNMTNNVPRGVDVPLSTLLSGNHKYLVAPVITSYHSPRDGKDRSDRAQPMGAPLPTQDTSNRFGVVAPFLSPVTHPNDQRVHSIEEPLRTITGANRGEEALIAPVMIPRYGEWENHPARGKTVDKPMDTIVPDGNNGSLVAAFLAKHQSERHADEVQAAPLDDAFPTIKTRDSHALVAAHVVKHYGGRIGSSMADPLHTVTAESVHHGVVASSLVKLKGTARDGQKLDAPLHTVQAGGNHYAEVRAFLLAYYGNEKRGRTLEGPMPTATARDRLGLVTVHGVDYMIVDIGMRMLVPRELARAQGFGEHYKLDIEFNGKPLSKEAQTSMIGNSVCPPLAAAIVAANATPASFAPGFSGVRVA